MAATSDMADPSRMEQPVNVGGAPALLRGRRRGVAMLSGE